MRGAALAVARSVPGGVFAGLLVRWVPRLVPRRRQLGRDVVVVDHPVPVADVHQLAISRGRVADVSVPAGAFWRELAAMWREGWAIGITNLGERQDVRLLHVHLLATPPAWTSGPALRQGHELPDLVAAVVEEQALAGRTASVAIAPDSHGWRCWIDPRPTAETQ